MGMGRGGRRGRGFPKECVCPNCGYKAPHQPGFPCRQMTCPRCGISMVRG